MKKITLLLFVILIIITGCANNSKKIKTDDVLKVDLGLANLNPQNNKLEIIKLINFINNTNAVNQTTAHPQFQFHIFLKKNKQITVNYIRDNLFLLNYVEMKSNNLPKYNSNFNGKKVVISPKLKEFITPYLKSK